MIDNFQILRSTVTRTVARAVMAASVCISLAACGVGGTRDLTVTHDPILADRMLEEQPVAVNPHTGRPTVAGFDNLDRFVMGLGAGYGDRISVSGGDASSRRDVVRHLARRGYFRARDAGGAGEGLMVRLSRIVLTPPTCGDWRAEDQDDASNLPPRNFGCANHSNLARMIADPHDLFNPDPGPFEANSEREVFTIEALRAHRIEISTAGTASETTGD